MILPYFVKNVKETVRYGLKTVLYRSLFLWKSLSQEYIANKYLSAFKSDIRR